MNNITGQWVGQSYGTHPANIFAEFYEKDDTIFASIKACLNVNQEVFVFAGMCLLTDQKIIININQSLDNHFTVEVGHLDLSLSTTNLMEGTFTLNQGAKGIIKLFKYVTYDAVTESSKPPQIIIEQYPLNYPIAIYKKDIEEIITILENLGTNVNIVITQETDHTKIAKFAKDYLSEQKHGNDIDSLVFTAQFVESGFTNTLTIVLNRSAPSTIVAQAAGRIWGAILLKDFLEKRTNRILGFYRLYGLQINGIVFLILLVILPGFDIRLRIVWVAGFLIFIFLHYLGYRIISNSTIEPDTNEAKKFKEKYPKFTYIGIIFLNLILTGIFGYFINNAIKFFKSYINI